MLIHSLHSFFSTRFFSKAFFYNSLTTLSDTHTYYFTIPLSFIHIHLFYTRFITTNCSFWDPNVGRLYPVCQKAILQTFQNLTYIAVKCTWRLSVNHNKPFRSFVLCINQEDIKWLLFKVLTVIPGKLLAGLASHFGLVDLQMLFQVFLKTWIIKNRQTLFNTVLGPIRIVTQLFWAITNRKDKPRSKELATQNPVLMIHT